MVYFLTRISIINSVEFLQGYNDLNDNRIQSGCISSRYFTNIRNEKIVTILSEWKSEKQFFDYLDTYSNTYDDDYEEGMVEMHKLEKRIHKIKAAQLVERIAMQSPFMFAHWRAGMIGAFA